MSACEETQDHSIFLPPHLSVAMTIKISLNSNCYENCNNAVTVVIIISLLMAMLLLLLLINCQFLLLLYLLSTTFFTEVYKQPMMSTCTRVMKTSSHQPSVCLYLGMKFPMSNCFHLRSIYPILSIKIYESHLLCSSI